MPNNYYAADFDPWVNNIRGMGSMMMQMPALKARMAAQQQLANFRAAEMNEANARTGLLTASTEKTKAQTADQEDQTASGGRLAVALKKVTTNPNDTDAAGDAISEFGHYFKKNPEQAAKGMGDLYSHFMAMRGDTNFAQQGSLQGNAASIANDQANNARILKTPMVVPDNSVAIDKTTGQPVATSPQRLSMGQRLFEAGPDNVTLNTQPAVQGAPEPPKTPLANAIKLRAYAQAVNEDVKNGTTNAPTVLKRLDAVLDPGVAGVNTNAGPAAPYIQPTAPGPAQPTVMVTPNGGGTNNVPSAQDLITQAQDAINRGADPVKVKSRLLNQYKINLP